MVLEEKFGSPHVRVPLNKQFITRPDVVEWKDSLLVKTCLKSFAKIFCNYKKLIHHLNKLRVTIFGLKVHPLGTLPVKDVIFYNRIKTIYIDPHISIIMINLLVLGYHAISKMVWHDPVSGRVQKLPSKTCLLTFFILLKSPDRRNRRRSDS